VAPSGSSGNNYQLLRISRVTATGTTTNTEIAAATATYSETATATPTYSETATATPT
jgi:hypothetical protein